MASKANLLHPNPVKRAEVMHDNNETVPWNNEHLEAAKEQFQNPVMSLITSIKNSALGVLRGTVKLGTDLVTHPIATIANAGQLVWDTATKLPARGLVIVSDTISKGVFGNISKWSRQIKEKIHAVMEPKATGPGKHVSPNAHGAGHDAGHGAAHH